MKKTTQGGISLLENLGDESPSGGEEWGDDDDGGDGDDGDGDDGDGEEATQTPGIFCPKERYIGAKREDERSNPRWFWILKSIRS
eukprot:CAMPEP_0201482234 /NCGR_PEP_ID=MMETSP0151_2-20130828/6514_1 /ASSEMBLY_ACC=CAM_ASM_000257 /TAXON_ID=200890 /ORGANISM="Paramoeba atlantica, Strain 621/1 / CCAP 1560/9" /LENGTH=84 /DNA_ID=CAMNT_0047864829 /DNA_START=227 /DNA_END=482 /DNA_ORIENTATION=-